MENENESQNNTNTISNLNESQNLNIEDEITTSSILPIDCFYIYSKDLTGIEINEFKEGEIIETKNYILQRCENIVKMIEKNKPIKDDNNYFNEIDIKNQESEDNKSEIENFPQVTANSELEKKNAEAEKIKKKEENIKKKWMNLIPLYPGKNNNNDYNSKIIRNIKKTESKPEKKLIKNKNTSIKKNLPDKISYNFNIKNDGEREDYWRKKIFSNLYKFPFINFKNNKSIFPPDHLLVTQNANITLLIIFLHLKYLYLCQMTITRYKKLCESLEKLSIKRTYKKTNFNNSNEDYSKKDILSNKIYENICNIQKIYQENNNKILNEDLIKDLLEKRPLDSIDSYESSPIFNEIKQDERNEKLKNIPNHIYLNEKGDLMKWIKSNPEYKIIVNNKDIILKIISKIFSENINVNEEKKKNDEIRKKARLQNNKNNKKYLEKKTKRQIIISENNSTSK